MFRPALAFLGQSMASVKVLHERQGPGVAIRCLLSDEPLELAQSSQLGNYGQPCPPAGMLDGCRPVAGLEQRLGGVEVDGVGHCVHRPGSSSASFSSKMACSASSVPDSTAAP